MVIWLTGLSGAGKSTLATALSAKLRNAGHSVVQLDGDELRALFGAEHRLAEQVWERLLAVMPKDGSAAR
jgi:adenylylsulfate kinase-like enzyme